MKRNIFSEEIIQELITNNTIGPTHYPKYEVKRGLRNENGTGVLVGLTDISSVIGSEIIDRDIFPMDGKLKYRCIPVEDLAYRAYRSNRSGFEETAFLLLLGRLPTEEELKDFSDELASKRHLSPEIIDIIKNIRSKNIMNKLQTCVSALYGQDKDPENNDIHNVFRQSVELIAKFPAIIAYSYLVEFTKDPKLVEPLKKGSAAKSFLHILKQGGEVTKLEEETLDLSLILHAEHGGGNNSTFTAHVVTSSGTDTYSTMAAALSSLKGPLHGAANKAVIDMMADIKKNVKHWTDRKELIQYLKAIINKQAYDKKGLVYGIGHAIYTKSDPRAMVFKEKAKAFAEATDREDEYNLYLDIERFTPDIFKKIKKSDKVIAPNVDFYTGFVYDCMGLPAEIYTPIFAMARIVGWSAHRIEELLSGKRIIRPAYKYVPRKNKTSDRDGKREVYL